MLDTAAGETGLLADHGEWRGRAVGGGGRWTGQGGREIDLAAWRGGGKELDLGLGLGLGMELGTGTELGLELELEHAEELEREVRLVWWLEGRGEGLEKRAAGRG